MRKLKTVAYGKKVTFYGTIPASLIELHKARRVYRKLDTKLRDKRFQ